ncbi:LeuA family protein [Desulfohalovibrio reitneri]|uniref:LeuA family protein n=1 Tax=Desulfohalovibrio reitneri TaxID=1307759 RepID=UPI0004A75472|nr:hypothetical protein [Desulfohalovibrio reitneri]
MLIDTTLREGEQRYGVYFDAEAKLALLDSLLAAGVEEIECGVAGRCPDTPGLVARGRERAGQGQAISVWCRAAEADLELAASLRPDRVCLGLPVADAHLEKRLRISRAGLVHRLERLLIQAEELGVAYLSVGLEDASRADPEFALAVARAARDGGARRVRLSDTVGALSPLETARLVERFRSELPGLDLAVHCHDDLGLATANALTALDSGADAADCACLGLGERAGIAATERLAMRLNLDGRGDYALEAITKACRVAARSAGMEVPGHAPVVGERLFWVESGLHADTAAKAPGLHEPWAPALTGHARRAAVGKKSGRAAVRRKLEELGMAPEAEDLERLTSELRDESLRMGRVLDDGEVARLAARAC